MKDKIKSHKNFFFKKKSKENYYKDQFPTNSIEKKIMLKNYYQFGLTFQTYDPGHETQYPHKKIMKFIS